MNILIFSAIYPAPAEYGIRNDTKVVHYFAKQWKNSGHTVQVVHLHMIPVKEIVNITNLKKCNGFESDYEFDGVDVHLLEYQMMVPKINYLLPFQAKNAEQRISKFIERSFVPDRVFVHFPCSFKGIKCISNLECPTMAVLHNSDIDILQKNLEMYSEINCYQNIGGRNNIICDVASNLLSREVSLVLSGIDESLIPSFEVIEKKLTQLQRCVKIVYAGNLIKLKNVDIIIEALEKVNFEYEFDIIGNGPEDKKLVSMANGNSKIIFRGRMSRETTIQKMRKADVFVMVSSPETFGLVYVEAMAQGCIVVGSRNEGIDGVIIDGENGFLVEPGNVSELVECLERIQSMGYEQKKKIVHSAYHKAAAMTDLAMAIKYLELNKE